MSLTEGEEKLIAIASKTAAEASAKAASEISAQNSAIQERILGDVRALTKTCDRIEASLQRGGERMEKIEAGNVACDKHSAVTDTRLDGIERDIKETIKDEIADLKGTRSKMSWAIACSYLAGIIAKVWK